MISSPKSLNTHYAHLKFANHLAFAMRYVIIYACQSCIQSSGGYHSPDLQYYHKLEHIQGTIDGI